MAKAKPSKAAARSKPATKKPAPAKKPAQGKKSKAKPPAKKAPTNKAPAKKPATSGRVKPSKKPLKPAPKPTAKVPAKVAAKAAPAAKAPMDAKAKPKGINVIDKPVEVKKPVAPPGKPGKKPIEIPNFGGPLLGPGKKWKPLIVSGPNAPKVVQTGSDLTSLEGKTNLSRKELDHYRAILIRKRGELVGDINTMEGQVLKDNSGSLSHTPQHAAEQGSDAYEQALSLDIAEVDRNLIREIDDALARIDNASYGLCQKTGKPISKERLEELPWTRYSIEAARELEKKQFAVPRGSGAESARASAASGD